MEIKSVKFVEAFYDAYGIIDSYNAHSPEAELIDPNCEVNACLVETEDGRLWLFAGEQSFMASPYGHQHKEIMQLDRKQGGEVIKWIDKSNTYRKAETMEAIADFLEKSVETETDK